MAINHLQSRGGVKERALYSHVVCLEVVLGKFDCHPKNGPAWLRDRGGVGEVS